MAARLVRLDDLPGATPVMQVFSEAGALLFFLTLGFATIMTLERRSNMCYGLKPPQRFCIPRVFCGFSCPDSKIHPRSDFRI